MGTYNQKRLEQIERLKQLKKGKEMEFQLLKKAFENVETLYKHIYLNSKMSLDKVSYNMNNLDETCQHKNLVFNIANNPEKPNNFSNFLLDFDNYRFYIYCAECFKLIPYSDFYKKVENTLVPSGLSRDTYERCLDLTDLLRNNQVTFINEYLQRKIIFINNLINYILTTYQLNDVEEERKYIKDITDKIRKNKLLRNIVDPNAIDFGNINVCNLNNSENKNKVRRKVSITDIFKRNKKAH